MNSLFTLPGIYIPSNSYPGNLILLNIIEILNKEIFNDGSVDLTFEGYYQHKEDSFPKYSKVIKMIVATKSAGLYFIRMD